VTAVSQYILTGLEEQGEFVCSGFALVYVIVCVRACVWVHVCVLVDLICCYYVWCYILFRNLFMYFNCV